MGLFAEYEKYLRELASFYDWESRTAAIKVILFNDGSCPADDVDIFMHFPDGFELFNEDEYEKEPEAPGAPRKPRSVLEEAAGAYSLGTADFIRPSYLDDLSRFRLPTGPSNVSGPRIKRTNSYDVKVGVRKAKQSTAWKYPWTLCT
jgi:hypothetical protein